MDLIYDLDVALANYDRLAPLLITGQLLAMTAFYLYYWLGIKQGFKDKTSGMPWQTNMYNFANDVVYVAAFWSWFNPESPTNHWVTKVLWVGLALWFIMEIVIHYQSIKWDLQTEIFPNAKNRRNALLMYWAVQACFVAGYAFIWSVLDDPIVHVMFLTTYTGCVIFNFSMTAKRGSRRGMHPAVPWALVVAQFAGYFMVMPGLDPIMANPFTFAMGIAAVGLAIAYAVIYQRTPEYKPEITESEATKVEVAA